ncbi:hypothetical protein Cri9333_1007 [Crinalium epipsammum PCC 9333]|uniref:Uncharacterized protein n=1 Tax=Crinalium epipsammum PCC 9333 TaxID=1173022 RepID=K9VWP6_9CYAN|nr:hypothetical protein [Crinalium epipsammum]AFZ11922.1 hypothetical protein Cri9333_1007 [Crinalium epipsammum PCC 9333]
MADPQELSAQFLTREESIKVDAALLTSQDKFVTRLALYALKSLKQIAQETGAPIENITPQQLSAWIEKDETFKQEIENDATFEDFFTRLVISSLNPLKQVSQAANLPIEDLTVEQVIAWFEKQAKLK